MFKYVFNATFFPNLQLYLKMLILLSRNSANKIIIKNDKSKNNEDKWFNSHEFHLQWKIEYFDVF